jgi:dTDP-glucose 4,6-dehydratase
MSSIILEDAHNVVQRVGSAFDSLEGRRIVLTGGTGFVGSNLIESVAFLNQQVFGKPCKMFIVARHPEGCAKRHPHLIQTKSLILIPGDIRTLNFPRESFDFIIHAASPADPITLARNPLETMEVIGEGTRRVLGMAVERGVERVLFLSSGAVYGPQPPGLDGIPEEFGGGPDIRDWRGAYGEAKRYAEMLCQVVRTEKGLDVVVARLFAFVGPYMDINSSFAVMDFIRQGLRDRTIRVKSDGSAIRSLCYSSDMVTALWKILLCGNSGAVYNVGSDRDAVSIRELALRVAKLLGAQVEVRVEGREGKDTLRPRYVPDVTKLKEDLGLAPAYDLDSALIRTIAHLKEQQPPVESLLQLTQ